MLDQVCRKAFNWFKKHTHTHISYDGCYWNFVDWFLFCYCDLDGSNENCSGLGVCATSWCGVYTKVSRHCAIHYYIQIWLLLLNFKHCQELLSQVFVPVIFCLNQSPTLLVVERCLDKMRELQGSVEGKCKLQLCDEHSAGEHWQRTINWHNIPRP